MGNGTQMVYDQLRYLASAGIGAGYVAVGGVFEHPMRIITITNLTNETILVSTDGINDYDVVPGNSGKVLDICAGRNGGDFSGAYIAINSTIYVKSATGASTGDGVYVTCLYIFGD